jgi:hypothetical protein
MPTRRRSRATRLASQVMELSLAVPEVVSRRVSQMAFAGLSRSAGDREEFFRMNAEKISAFYESWNGMFVAVCRANSQLFLVAPAWSPPWVRPRRRPRRAQLQQAALDILASGVPPIHRRAVANAKRLRK